jgi:outer membrane lipoprotein
MGSARYTLIMRVLATLPRFRSLSLGLLAIAACVSACATSQLVTPELKPHIARDVSFEALKADPQKYQGRLLVLGGKVLNAKRLKDQTQIEVLQLPLNSADGPIPDLSLSRGRFLAYQTEFLDPATLPPGTLISMVAEVLGSKTQPLDEVEYTYPTVKIRRYKIWPQYERPPYPYYSPWYPYWDRWGYPFWDPWTIPYWGMY